MKTITITEATLEVLSGEGQTALIENIGQEMEGAAVLKLLGNEDRMELMILHPELEEPVEPKLKEFKAPKQKFAPAAVIMPHVEAPKTTETQKSKEDTVEKEIAAAEELYNSRKYKKAKLARLLAEAEYELKQLKAKPEPKSEPKSEADIEAEEHERNVLRVWKKIQWLESLKPGQVEWAMSVIPLINLRWDKGWAHISWNKKFYKHAPNGCKAALASMLQAARASGLRADRDATGLKIVG